MTNNDASSSSTASPPLFDGLGLKRRNRRRKRKRRKRRRKRRRKLRREAERKNGGRSG